MDTKIKAGPKDVFLHLLSIITLYVSASGLIALIFDYINVWLPDAVSENYYSLISYYSSIRWEIAILIVVFPVYVWTVWYLNKGYGETPEKRNLKIRKWLVYFTLFLAAIIIIGDSVTLIYNLLQGELGARFLLKILAVLVVAGVTFGYYLMDLREKAPHKIFAYGVSLVILIAVASGFFIVGSPKEERSRRFDDQRVQDLQFIQSEIVNRFVQKGKLPVGLTELDDSIRGIAVPKDPESSSAYVYEIKDSQNFKLCATFNRQSLDQAIMPGRAKPTAPYPEATYYGQENWAHGAGETCFDRKIDKDLYKPAPKS